MNNELTVYVYNESEGVKGGNNVASLNSNIYCWKCDASKREFNIFDHGSYQKHVQQDVQYNNKKLTANETFTQWKKTCQLLSLEDKVNVVPAHGKFCDWGKEFNEVYQRSKAGSVYKITCVPSNIITLKIYY